MSEFKEPHIIETYIKEWERIETAVQELLDRQTTIDLILRNEHNFAIGEDVL